MAERDEMIRKMRPTVPQPEAFVSEEQFEQHSVLPLIKFQSSLLFSQFRTYLKERKPAFNAFNQKVQKALVRDLIKADKQVQRALINTVTSLFTMEEFTYYQKHQLPLNRRITVLVSERFQNNLEQLL